MIKLFRRRPKTLEERRIRALREHKAQLSESAQAMLRFNRIGKDGIMSLGDGAYSKTIAFSDLNYRLARYEDKEVILAAYCSFLNFFDETVDLQLTFFNQTGGMTALAEDISIPPKDDAFNDIREEYSRMIQTQVAKGNNGVLKRKFITVTIQADTKEEAVKVLDRMEADVINNFKSLGVDAYGLDGKERVELLHDILTTEPMRFNWDQVDFGGHEKNYIVPGYFNLKDPRYIDSEKQLQISYLNIEAPELSDDFLSSFIDLNQDLVISMHIKPMNRINGLTMIKHKLTDVEKMKIDENKKAFSIGYDPDILPPDLKNAKEEMEDLLRRIQQDNEQLFYISFTFLHLAETKEKLDAQVKLISQMARRQACTLYDLKYEQEFALNHSLPFGKRFIKNDRILPTTAAAVFIPFTTQELIDLESEDSLYYGLNALSNNLIYLDRKKLRAPNGLILGTPGSGKSFAAKREIANAFLVTNDDIIIVDPEAEYMPITKALGGEVIDISANSANFINPMDVELDIDDDDNPDQIRTKAEFVLALFEIIGGGKYGLSGSEISIIDRCVRLCYKDYMKERLPDRMPTLETLYNILVDQNDPTATRLASILEIYVKGSLSVFNHRTNININSRVVTFVLKDLSETLKKMAMLIVQDTIWARLAMNKNRGIMTRYYIDEFHVLLKDKQTASYFTGSWKRLRKWHGAPTGITQNVKDFLQSPEIENIFDTSDFFYLLNQNSGDQEHLAKRLKLSRQQISFVENSGEGEGLMIYNGIIIPFRDRFPKDTKLYQLMTTKPSEVLEL